LSIQEKGNPDSGDKDFSFECNPDIPPRLQPGEYEVAFLRAEKKWLWNGEKVFLWFQIITLGKHPGEKLYMACNVAPKGKWRASFKFYRAWVIAEVRKPDRCDRMSTKVFKNKLFRVRVATVEKTSKGTKRIPELQYSVIDEIIERVY